ncbi:MAG: hypothetical protein AAFV32_06305 [Myxococcota bacterium]
MSVAWNRQPTQVVHIEVDGAHTYFAGESGLLTHNKWLVDRLKGLLGKKPSKGVAQVTKNKAAGDAFEDAIGAELRATNEVAAPQITIKTASGTRTRVDFVTKNGDRIGCVECKASATAPLTKNQRAAFPEIGSSGGVVVGKGKRGVPGGTVIPPTSVKIRRP